MPKYLNFVKGVVHSDDLPLNVSREQLVQMKMIKVMSKKLVRKAIEMIRNIADESEYEYIDEDDEEYDEADEETEEDDDSEEEATDEAESDDPGTDVVEAVA